MSQTAVKTHKAIKEVQVIARYELKQHPGIIVYKVRSSNGVNVYETVIAYGKMSSCTCKSVYPCYHLKQCLEREQARIALEHKIDADIEEHLADEQFPKKLSREEYNREFQIYG